MIKPVEFNDKTWAVLFKHYVDGGDVALVLVDPDPLKRDPSDYVIATVNLDERPRPGYVFIKNWSENWGILPALVAAGVIETSTRLVPTGYVFADECKLLMSEAESAPDSLF